MFSVNLVSCNSAQNLLLGLWKSILYFFSGLVTIRSITKVLLFHRWQSLLQHMIQHMKCFNQSIYHNTRDCIKWLIIYKENFKKRKKSLTFSRTLICCGSRWRSEEVCRKFTWPRGGDKHRAVTVWYLT